MGRKVSITTALEEKQLEDLEGLRDVTRKARAVLIREAIDAYLVDHCDLIPAPEPDPRQVPLDLTGKDHRACGACPECARGRFAECAYYATVPT